MEAPKFIQNIDWELLKKQKQSLITIIEWNKLPLLKDDLDGILSLIDATQDYAVDELGLDKDVVFDLTESKKIIGYQVLDENNDIHPDMDTSYSIYSYNRAMGMLGSDTESRYRLVTIREGDIENPTFMFKR